ncbi:tetratricopeptide repeat protein [Streptomyces sp. Sge12]|uniref:tetratricopeptide repeat protein n=1 Tax=Streptomyces sp. Sge12 TaxID=1972846 RepID=UPI00193BBCCC|nr:tetratricopeptide repeat protein [Streptomyces sp. Sge12]
MTGNPTAYEPDLARALSNLGIYLSGVGRRAEALDAVEEAVEVHRRLADPVTGNPTAYEPDLATSLTVWAWLLSTQQNLSRALRATSEAVEIYRKLVALVPSRFTQPLRAVLSLQADVLDGLGRIQDAQTIRDWLAANPDEPDSHK